VALSGVDELIALRF